MEIFSALLAICAGNSPVPVEFLAQRPVTRSFDVFLDLRLNKRLSKQSWGWWFETPSRPLWRHCNDQHCICCYDICWHREEIGGIWHEASLYTHFIWNFNSYETWNVECNSMRIIMNFCAILTWNLIWFVSIVRWDLKKIFNVFNGC